MATATRKRKPKAKTTSQELVHVPGRGRVGRPLTLTQALIEKIVATCYETGCYAVTAAEANGVPEGTFRNWVAVAAEQEAEDTTAPERYALQVQLCRRLKEAEAKVEAEDAAAVRNHAERWSASAWRLERKHAHRWGRRVLLDATDDGRATIADLMAASALEVQEAMLPATVTDGS